jgi:hypothetical protein
MEQSASEKLTVAQLDRIQKSPLKFDTLYNIS